MVESKDNENLEATEETVDPRLDNRVGNQRPPLESFPAKPQQVDGPEVSGTPTVREVAESAENLREDNVTRKGMHSPGPHGLGETEPVEYDSAKVVREDADAKAKTASEQAKTTKKDSK